MYHTESLEVVPLFRSIGYGVKTNKIILSSLPIKVEKGIKAANEKHLSMFLAFSMNISNFAGNNLSFNPKRLGCVLLGAL